MFRDLIGRNVRRYQDTVFPLKTTEQLLISKGFQVLFTVKYLEKGSHPSIFCRSSGVGSRRQQSDQRLPSPQSLPPARTEKTPPKNGENEAPQTGSCRAVRGLLKRTVTSWRSRQEVTERRCRCTCVWAEWWNGNFSERGRKKKEKKTTGRPLVLISSLLLVCSLLSNLLLFSYFLVTRSQSVNQSVFPPPFSSHLLLLLHLFNLHPSSPLIFCLFTPRNLSSLSPQFISPYALLFCLLLRSGETYFIFTGPAFVLLVLLATFFTEFQTLHSEMELIALAAALLDSIYQETRSWFQF